MNDRKWNETDIAIKMAKRALDIQNADPDDDLRTISRQFLMLVELLNKEQDAAHFFETTPKWVADYNANRQAVNVLETELTRLREYNERLKIENLTFSNQIKILIKENASLALKLALSKHKEAT